MTQPTQQNFDVISFIQELKHLIRAPIQHLYVTGSLDSKRPYDSLTRAEYLNIEADYLAKGVRLYGRSYPQFVPNLILPFEPISVWCNGFKIYHHFKSDMPKLVYTDT